MDDKVARIALAALFGGAIAIAFSPIFVRLSELGPTATAFWRLALALPVLGLWLVLAGRGTAPPRQPANLADYRRLIIAGLCMAGDLAVWHWSIKLTSVANATLLANAAPIFVTLGAWLFLKERFSPVFFLGMAAALAGAAMLVGSSVGLSLQHIFGDALGLLAAVFYAGYILTIKQLRRDFSTATIMTWSGLVTCSLLWPVALLSGESLLATILQGWVILAGLALVSHVAGQSMVAYALAHLPAPFSSVSLLLQPAIAALLAWLFLSEPLSFWQTMGGVIVLAGVVLARRGSRL